MLAYSPTGSARPHRSRRLLAAAAVVTAASVGLTACGDEDTALRTPDGQVISTVTSRIAEANIVSAGRDFAETCLAPTAPDPGRADVSRVIVTDPALLDAVCALGIGPKVRAVTAPEGSIPEYLGPELGAVPAIGDHPSREQVAQAAPQLVLATPDTAGDVTGLRDSGALGSARVATVSAGADWRKTFSEVAAALQRTNAADERLAEFDAEATRVGRVMDAAHSQVSLVRFTPSEELLQGTDNFGASILAQVGAQRPAAQRGPEPVVVTEENFRDADGDLIYVSGEGDEGMQRGIDVLESDSWQEMGAPSWQRVMWVDDAVWYRTSGLAAAWLVLNDVKNSLNSSSAAG